MRRLTAALLLVCGAAWCAPPVWAGESQALLLRVSPARSGGMVVCRLQTSGLPGAKQLQSMRSGLVSSVEVNLMVVDESDEPVAGRSVSLRLAFDLWDEVFSVREDGRERRFHTLADLQAYLANLGELPVIATTRLDTLARYRLQAAMVVHAVAPDEQQRVADVVAGDRRPRREGLDQQEASVSLGRLIRLFYKGDEADTGRQVVSNWFTRKELPDATH